MKKATVLGAFASAFILATTFAAQAAEWHEGPPALRYSGKPETAARAYLKNYATNLRIDGIELKQRNVLALHAMKTVQYQQRHGGLPVFGKMIAVRVDPSGVIRAAAVDVARGLTVSTTPAIDGTQAVDLVAAHLGRPLSTQHVGLELGVLPYESQGGILVWHVDVMQSDGMRRYVLNAHTAQLMHDYSLAHDAVGRVYEVNPTATPTLTEVELPDLDSSDPAKLSGFEGGLKAYGYASGDISYNAIQTKQTDPSGGEDFLFNPSTQSTSLDDPFGEVMSYYHAARMRHYYEDTFGLDMSSSDYSLAVVSSYAPSSSPDYIMNAFFSPWYPGYDTFPDYARNIICLGRGYGEDIAYDSDVLLHEFTHYVSHNAMSYTEGGWPWDQYGSIFMPGAINEGTADYFSSTLNNNPIVGEYALSYGARNLTEDAGKCPDNVFGESHEDGKLIGSAGWALREAFGAEIADQLVWGALSFLGSSATLGDFGDGITQTAIDLGLDDAQKSKVAGILGARGLDDCGRALEIKGLPRKSFLLGLDFFGQLYMGGNCYSVKNEGIYLSSYFQFVFTPSSDDTGAEFAVQLDNVMGGGELDWNVYIRKNEMVTFNAGGYTAPSIRDYDYAFEGLTDSHLSIVLDGTSTPTFEKDASYYVVIWHQNCPTVSATIGAIGTKDLPVDAGVDAPVEHDAAGVDAGSEGGVIDGGAPDGDLPTTDLSADLEPGGGCGCRTTGTSTPSPLVGGLLALLAASVLRRRRR